jgi:trigger factor
MKVSVEELNKLQRRLSIEVPAEKVTESFKQAYKALQKQAQLKGFRKGKVPMEVLRSHYGDRVKQDVAEQLISQHYPEAVAEKDLNPVSAPSVRLESLEEDQPFSFSADFEIRPEVNLKNIEGLKVEREILELDPDHAKSVLENLRQQRAQFAPILEDRPVQMEDIAVIDFEGKMNGEPVENASGKDHNLEIGANQFIEGFEDGIVGMKIGETRDLSLTFPKEYHAEALAGQDVTFTVKLNAIKKRELPEINDEFAKLLGFETLDKLEETIREDHKKTEENRIREDFKNRLLKELVNKNPVDVPDSLLAEQKKMLVQDVQQRMKQQGMNDEQFKDYVEKWDGDFDQSASHMIQSGFLINALAKQENLIATDEDVKGKIKEFAEQSGLELDKVESFYKEESKRSNLQYNITEERVIEYLTERANIKEVKKDEIRKEN